MNTSASKFKDVDDYIAKARPEVRAILKQIRTIIQKTSPSATESIAYGMPAYKLNGKPLVYFASFDKHIGLYATPESHKEFSKQLAHYKQGKGSVQFPLDQPIPYDLIKKIVSYKSHKLGDVIKAVKSG